jgi:hypothetical protein
VRSWQGEPTGPVDPDAARQAADEILSRPEYREPQPSLVDRALDAIGDLLGRAIGMLTGGGAGSVIGLVVTVALLLLASWFLYRALRASSLRRSAPAADPVVQGTTAPDDPEVWRAEAERLTAAGDHRGALRCRYQELVARLVRSRAVAHDPSRTPDELRRDLRSRRPDLAPGLDLVTDRFEVVWYGGAPASRDELDDYVAVAADVAERAQREPAVPA